MEEGHESLRSLEYATQASATGVRWPSATSRTVERSVSASTTHSREVGPRIGRHQRPARLPIHYPNPRDLPVNPGKPSSAPGAQKPPVCRHVRVESAPQVLLAMQKVVGSNPISRFRKGLHLPGLFRVISWVVPLRSWGLMADWRGHPCPGSAPKARVSRHFVTPRTADLFRGRRRSKVRLTGRPLGQASARPPATWSLLRGSLVPRRAMGRLDRRPRRVRRRCESVALAGGLAGEPSSPTVRLWLAFIEAPTGATGTARTTRAS
jgi:hypothetical protein